MANITIKKGGVTVSASDEDLVEVNETPDGVTFSFKGGLLLQYIDTYMPSGNKQVIKNTADRFTGKSLVFDLDNPRKPAMVDAT